VLSVSGTTRVLVATTPVDLRGSFNRLYSLVVEQLKDDPLSGRLFVFANRRQNSPLGSTNWSTPRSRWRRKWRSCVWSSAWGD
jgi:transposase